MIIHEEKIITKLEEKIKILEDQIKRNSERQKKT